MPRNPAPSAHLIAPDPAAPRLARAVSGVDRDGRGTDMRGVEERPPTICLNPSAMPDEAPRHRRKSVENRA